MSHLSRAAQQQPRCPRRDKPERANAGTIRWRNDVQRSRTDGPSLDASPPSITRRSGERAYAYRCRDARDVRHRRRRWDLGGGQTRSRRTRVDESGHRLCGRAGRRRQRGPDGPVRGRQRLAQGHQHAARQRQMDLRRGTGRVRGKPQSRVHALPRRAARNGRAAEHLAAAAGAQHQLPGGRVCGAMRRPPRFPESAAPIRTPENG